MAGWTLCLAKEVDDVLRIFMSRLTTLKYRALDLCNMFFLFTMLHHAFAMELLSFMASVYHKGKLAYVLSCGVFPIQSLVLLRRNI